jgi:hypothetical protein
MTTLGEMSQPAILVHRFIVYSQSDTLWINFSRSLLPKSMHEMDAGIDVPTH